FRCSELRKMATTTNETKNSASEEVKVDLLEDDDEFEEFVIDDGRASHPLDKPKQLSTKKNQHHPQAAKVIFKPIFKHQRKLKILEVTSTGAEAFTWKTLQFLLFHRKYITAANHLLLNLARGVLPLVTLTIHCIQLLRGSGNLIARRTPEVQPERKHNRKASAQSFLYSHYKEHTRHQQSNPSQTTCPSFFICF
ncbi:hypothetical protein Dimus_030206, partial [Dionaea muscipula]